MITIYIDNREKIPLETKKLREKGYTIVENTPLRIGDVHITNGVDSVYYEIKKGNDLFSSKLDGRLEAQMNDLSQVAFGIIAFVGDMYDINNVIDKHGNEIKGISGFYKDYPNRIISLKTSITGRCKFVEYKNLFELEKAILYWSNQIEKNKLNRLLIGGKAGRILKPNSLNTEYARKINMLASLEGIGHSMAKKILDAFNGDIQNALNSTDEEWLQIKGVKKKKVEALRKLGFKHVTCFENNKYHDTKSLKEKIIIQYDRFTNIMDVFD